MRIGILGGSFNPIHNGHLAIARGMIKRAIVDKVMLMVSPQNPIKSPESLLPEDIRFQLAQKACESECGIQVSNFEFFLPRPSYTWQTLEYILQMVQKQRHNRKFRNSNISARRFRHISRFPTAGS